MMGVRVSTGSAGRRLGWGIAVLLAVATLLALSIRSSSALRHTRPSTIADVSTGLDQLRRCEAEHGGRNDLCAPAAETISRALSRVDTLSFRAYRVSRFHVAASGSTLIMRSIACSDADFADVMHMNVFPRQADDVPAADKWRGFQSYVFRIADRGYKFGNVCVLTHALPAYPLWRLTVGRYDAPAKRFTWSVTLPFDAG